MTEPDSVETRWKCKLGAVQFMQRITRRPVEAFRVTSSRLYLVDGNDEHELTSTVDAMKKLAGLLGSDVVAFCEEYPREVCLFLTKLESLGTLLDAQTDPFILASTRLKHAREPLAPAWQDGVLRFSVSKGDPGNFCVYYDEYEYRPGEAASRMTSHQTLDSVDGDVPFEEWVTPEIDYRYSIDWVFRGCEIEKSRDSALAVLLLLHTCDLVCEGIACKSLDTAKHVAADSQRDHAVIASGIINGLASPDWLYENFVGKKLSPKVHELARKWWEHLKKSPRVKSITPFEA